MVRITPKEGEKIKRFMRIKHWTQIDLSRKLNWNPTDLSMQLSGKRVMSEGKIRQLYDVLERDSSVSFLKRYMEGGADVDSAPRALTDVAWHNLYEAHSNTLKGIYDQQESSETRMDIINSLEELIDRYNS
jgi:transcriptional regulator with XRE-family HTH domain